VGWGCWSELGPQEVGMHLGWGQGCRSSQRQSFVQGQNRCETNNNDNCHGDNSSRHLSTKYLLLYLALTQPKAWSVPVLITALGTGAEFSLHHH
jgi:hypothetical protein